MDLKILFLGIPTEKLNGLAEPSTRIEGIRFDSRVPHLEYEFYENIAAHEVVREIVGAEKQGYDAAVIGCFYDPGLGEARELVEMPVVGVCEASLSLAAMISAGRFSVLVGRRKWIPKMMRTAKGYGFDSRIASWRVLGLTVPEMRDVEKTREAVLRESRRAIEEDMVECLVLGCTCMLGRAIEAQEELGAPVLDPVLCGIKVAEMRAVLWRRFGISHSKIGGYEPPPNEELESIWEKIYSPKI
jgi:allantoin racemase